MLNLDEPPSVILLVEDSKADQNIVRRAIKKGKIKTDCHIVDDGQEAMDFLRRQGRFADSPRPNLILLDMNLPRLNGKEVLRQIRADEKLKDIAVIMLTTSDHERDVIESYQLGVNAYIKKPVEVGDFFEAILKLEEFWFELVVLPPH